MARDDGTDAPVDDHDSNDDADPPVRDVLVVGGGVAGLTVAVFTARAGLDTLVVNDGESILRRNAHLENFPGFPAGVNSRLFADMLEAQATRNGADLREGRVTALERPTGEGANEGEGFVARVVDGQSETKNADGRGGTSDGDDARTIRATRVVAASWADAGYLDGLDVSIRDAGSKRYVAPDGDGRTDVDGLYAAGRLGEMYHQAVVCAGHGAQVAITLIHDSDVPYYHDWVVPEGYFTDRGREVPPGCEEIDATEREVRERESMAAMREYFSEPHPDVQRTHPSLVDDERGRLSEDE